MLAWHVVIAKLNQDHLAARGLREQQFDDVYLPKTFEKRTLASGGKRPVGSLLLSPYLFVLMDPAKGHHSPIKNTRGVQELLCDPAGNPKALHDGFRVISQLRQAEDEELCAALAAPNLIRTDLRRGMRVRIEKSVALVPNADGWPEGPIVLISRRKVGVLIGNAVFTVDEADISIASGGTRAV